MNGLTLIADAGDVAVVIVGKPAKILPIGTKLNLPRGARVQLGDATDSSCSLAYDATLVATVSKKKAGANRLRVKTYSPPVQSAKKLKNEYVFVASKGASGKPRTARVLRAALPRK